MPPPIYVDPARTDYIFPFNVLDITGEHPYGIAATVLEAFHRTGRVDRIGQAFTFMEPNGTIIVKKIEKVLHKRIERRKLDGFDYDYVPKHHQPQPQRKPKPRTNQNTSQKSRSNQDGTLVTGISVIHIITPALAGVII